MSFSRHWTEIGKINWCVWWNCCLHFSFITLDTCKRTWRSI